MAKEERLRNSSQFRTVYEHGRTWACDFIVLKTLPNNLEYSRYGFVTSKRLGKAVRRNRVRRLLREAARSVPVIPGWDIVLIARSSAVTANYQQIKAAVTGIMHRARILADKGEANGIGKA